MRKKRALQKKKRGAPKSRTTPPDPLPGPGPGPLLGGDGAGPAGIRQVFQVSCLEREVVRNVRAASTFSRAASVRAKCAAISYCNAIIAL